MNRPRIRILFIVSSLSGGGAERVVSTILRYLDCNRFEPLLCLWRDEIVYPIPKDLKVHIIGKYKPWHLFHAIRQTRFLIKKWKPDVIYSHLSFVNLLTGLALLGKAQNTLWISCQHQDPEYSTNIIMKRILGLVLNRCYKVVAVSNGVRTACIKNFLLPDDKVITLYNPLELPEPLDNKEHTNHLSESYVSTLVAMGRLTKEKDYPTMFRALRLMKENMPIKLKILGDGPLYNKLKILAANLDIAEDVDFLGFVNDPFPIIRTSDVYVMSSVSEGLPTALIEAMACGVPVVSTRATYGPEEIIVDGESGLLVGVGDSNTLANSIIRILKDNSLRERLSKAGIVRVNSLFSKDNLIPQFERIIMNAVEHENR